MPKGGVLHAHLSAVNSRNFILNNITDRENLYVCRDQRDGAPRLRFFRYGAAAAASRVDRSCRWRLLAEVRQKDRSIDEEIDQALTMYAGGERLGRIRNSNDAWRKFLNLFDFVKSLFSFNFMDDHADFVAVKIIYSPHRNIPRSTLDEYIGKFRLFKEAYPELVVGFDLVGQEDRGRPLLDFVDELLELGRDTQFYFHAGETNWNGHEVDENLIDAVLLNAKRIGHGFALIKHPKLMEIVKEKKIVVEVSPISNQVLKLVGDMRNHPAAHFFATNLPVVISNDDPGFWGATGLSHDYYEAFVGIMSRKTDLRSLNSIEHSSLSDKERALAEEAWTRRWKTFVRQIIMDSDDRETLSSSYYRYEI
ncbi:unnamed protein product [Trichogramma brassicae]|uniref:Adenosine deaminase domain-containing protein n=1 Tax=Trichogramma brassicae TaxID=86971 RepID=A0A6H5HXN5_9HYME|nr:unnamed protein product [Trichogramma brassicae]